MSGALHVLEHNVLVYRRSWRGSLMISFIGPVLFLAAMGLGLGGLVNRTTGGVGGVPYLQFLAPGLLTAAAMQTAAIETTYPVMAKVYWFRTYDSMLATRLGVDDIVAGEVGWLAFRLLTVTAIFWAVMALFGTVHSWVALLAVTAALLTGLAFATPILAFAATQRNDRSFSYVFRFLIVPLFLFGGTFFPLDRLPAAIQGLVWLTPMPHGVTLARGMTTSGLPLGEAAVHVAVLVAYVVAGIAASRVALRRRLLR